MPATPRIDLLPVAPEIVLAGVAIVVLLLDAVLDGARRVVLLILSLAGVVGAAAAAIKLWGWDGDLTVLGGTVGADRFGVVARLIILPVTAGGLIFAHHYFERIGETRGEVYPLMLFAASGMTLIAAASDLIVVFLALEVLSLSLYVLTGFSFRLSASEASMKYFLLGAFSSAFFLYGVAMAYGASGSTHIGDLALSLAGRTDGRALALLAIAFLAVGFGFKVSAVPFHMWTPDVYQGSPTAVTAFMSAGTKVAAFFALIRVLDVGFQPLSWDWTPVVWTLAAITVIVGSVLAIAQSDVKRMLAYSSIAHAGFVLIALTAPNQDGIQAAMFYLGVYALTVLGAFGVVMLVSGRGEARTDLASYAGLGRRNPLIAGLMSLFLLSMAGIPPTAGFIAKANAFGAAVRAGHWPLVLIGVIASVAAAFFYIRVIVLMYMTEPSDDVSRIGSSMPLITVCVAGAAVLVLGVFPQLVLGFLEKAAVLRW